MNIAILDDYAGVSLNMADWDRLGVGTPVVFNTTLTDQQALIDRLMDFDVICVMRERTPFPAALLDKLPRLKLLVTTGPRNLSIDLEAATANGVLVCGTESRKTTTAELATLLMLSLSRRIKPETDSLHAPGWQAGLGRDLHGQTLGLIGLGKIGAQMTALGKAFGMTVHAWSPNLATERCAELDVRHHSTLPSLMAVSDVVSVHMVLSDRTQHLIGADAFSAMRSGAIFINTSRGPLVDQQALIDGLEVGKPEMAGIDVFDVEPLPATHPLRRPELIESGRLLLTPHLGYTTEQTFRVFYTQTLDAIEAWQRGSPIRTLNSP